jgi:hypothetical protein
MAYTIQPEAIAGVLADVTRTSNVLIEGYHSLEEPLESAGVGVGSSGLITNALGEVITWVQQTLGSARAGADACLEGAALATNTYLFGDEEMARAYQRGR